MSLKKEIIYNLNKLNVNICLDRKYDRFDYDIMVISCVRKILVFMYLLLKIVFKNLENSGRPFFYFTSKHVRAEINIYFKPTDFVNTVVTLLCTFTSFFHLN